MTANHVKIGFLTLCLALLLAIPTAWIARERHIDGIRTAIAVEHTSPITLRISRLASSGANVFEIGFTGSGSIALHLPASWKRQEVSGAPIASVTATSQEWDFVRWTLPAGATVRFDAPNPGIVTLHNPSGIPMTVSTIRVNAELGTRQDEATIVTDDPLVLP